ncbi:MAG TPA: glycosyltransferase family 39 protein [Candidatus Polarisedimenticolaceae bacterium]|nr:glycosyltransferase family 39 protein [Candidatus Polarisedimenticolaceae bacterium]
MEEKGVLALFAVILAALAVLFLRLGATPLLDPDEARFARTSVEMVRSHDYVVPTFEGQPRLVKPPLLHWIQASLFRIAGPSEMLARLPAAAATLVSLLLVAWIGWRRFGVEGAAWATAIFLTFPIVVMIGRIGTLDALLSVHVLAVVALDLVQPDDGGLQRSAVIGGLLGLAFLVKGPVGVALPLLIMLAGRTATGRELVPSLRSAITALLGWAAVTLPWGLVFIQRIGGVRAAATLRSEVLDRYVEGTVHVQPWWFFGGVAALGFLPWIVPLVLGTIRGLLRWRDAESPTGPYAAAALVAGLVFFSLGKGKLANYILPLAPLAALVVTFELGQELVHPSRNRAGPQLLTATLVALAIVLGAAGATRLENRAEGLAYFGAAVYGLTAVVALYGTVKNAPRISYAAAAMGSIVFLIGVVCGIPPFLAETRSTAPLVTKVPALLSVRPLVEVDINLPSLTYYADRVPERLSGPQLPARLAQGDNPLVVISDSDWPALAPEVRAGLREIGRSGKLKVMERSDRQRNSDESKPPTP